MEGRGGREEVREGGREGGRRVKETEEGGREETKRKEGQRYIYIVGTLNLCHKNNYFSE